MKVCVVSLNQQHRQDTVSALCHAVLTQTVALSVIVCPERGVLQFSKILINNPESLHPKDMLLKFNKDATDQPGCPIGSVNFWHFNRTNEIL